MQKTTNYGLNKPEKSDFYDIEHMNENMEKLDKHTHNYAGSSKAGGSATSAEKLATARKINGVDFDGSKDITTRKYCMVGSDSDDTTGWYKVASGTFSDWNDANIIFAVTSTYYRYFTGIFSIQIRSNKTNLVCQSLKWHTRIGFSAGDIICVVDGMTYTLYCKCGGVGRRNMFEVISESSINTANCGITLYNSRTKEETIPTPTVIASDGATVEKANRLSIASAIGSSKQPVYFNEKGEPVVADEISEKLVNEATDKLENSLAGASLVYLKDAGYTQQDGTPTPTAPIDVVGAGVDNLLNPFLETTTKNGVTVTDGKYVLPIKMRGKNFSPYNQLKWTYSGGGFVIDNKSIYLKANKTYTLQCDNATSTSGKGLEITFMDVTGTKNVSKTFMPSDLVNGTITFTPSADIHTFKMWANEQITIANFQIHEGTKRQPYEPYVEPITANIPIDNPLYEGDYIEIYADGGGEIVRNNTKKVITSSDFNGVTSIPNVFYYTMAKKYDSDIYIQRYINAHSNCFKIKTEMTNDENCATVMTFGNADWGGDVRARCVFPSTINTKELANEFVDNNEVYFIYPLKEPTRTPLTEEQIAEFKKLHTFNGTTYVNADGNVTVRYYCDSDGGKSMEMLQKMIEEKDHVATADSAGKLSNTKAIGSATNPVYFDANGLPVPTNMNDYKDGETLLGTWNGIARYRHIFKGVGTGATSTPQKVGNIRGVANMCVGRLDAFAGGSGIATAYPAEKIYIQNSGVYVSFPAEARDPDCEYVVIVEYASNIMT